MSISPARQEVRLGKSKKALAILTPGTPEHNKMIVVIDQQVNALDKAEKEYPTKLLSHLRRMSNSHNTDIKNRTKKQAKDLLAGIPIPAKVGTGNG